MYQEKVNIEQGIRPTGELLTDRSFLMPKTTKSDKNEQPEIMKDQEEFYFSKKFRTKPIQTFGMLIFQGLEGFIHTFHK